MFDLSKMLESILPSNKADAELLSSKTKGQKKKRKKKKSQQGSDGGFSPKAEDFDGDSSPKETNLGDESPKAENTDYSKVFKLYTYFPSINTDYYLEPFNKYFSLMGAPKAVSTSWRLYNVIAPLYGHAETIELLTKELIVVQALNTVSYYGSVSLADNLQDLTTELANMNAGEGAPEKIWSIIGYAAAAVIGLAIVETAKDYGIRHVEAKIKAKATDKLLNEHLGTDRIDSNGNPSKGLSYAYTMQSTEAAPFLPTMNRDIGTAARGLNTTVISSSTAFLSGAFALYSIYNISNMQGTSFFSLNNVLGAKIVCAGMVALVSSRISSDFSASNKERNKPQASAAKLENYLFNNSLFISALNTEKHTIGLIKRAFDAIRKVEVITTFLETMMKSWNFLSEKVNNLLDLTLVIYKKGSTAGFSKSDSSALMVNLKLVYDLLNWSTVNAKELSALDVTTTRLEAYNKSKSVGQKTGLFRTADNTENSILIRRGLKMTSNEVDENGQSHKIEKLKFNQDVSIPFRITKNNKDNIPYEVANRVSVNGGIGTGKSTLLKAIAGLELDKVSFQGNISFPASEDTTKSALNNIKLIPQEVNFSPATSMLDMLCLLKNKIDPQYFLQKKEFPSVSEQEHRNAHSAYQNPNTPTKLSAEETKIYNVIVANNSIDSLSSDARKFLDKMDVFDSKELSKEKKNPIEKEVQDFLIGCIAREAQEILLELGINDRFKKYFVSIESLNEIQSDWKNSLSGGMTKALCIVQVLTSDEKPQVLLLDETRGAIDPQNVRNLEKVLNERLPDTVIVEICHPEQNVDPRTHPYFTQVLNLDHFRVAEQNAAIAVTPTRNMRSPRNFSYHRSASDSNLPGKTVDGSILTQPIRPEPLSQHRMGILSQITEEPRSRGNSVDYQNTSSSSDLGSPPKIKRKISDKSDGPFYSPGSHTSAELRRRQTVLGDGGTPGSF